jgi:multiple sugar transport system substrate-binding protein
VTTAALVLGLTTPAWGSTNGAQRTQVTFSYLWTGPQAAAIQKIVAQFNASQNKITVVGISSPDFQKQLASMSASHGSFDISDNFGTSVCSWATKGILQPLSGYLKADNISTSDFVPATFNQMKCNGQVYELPVSLDDFELMYNKTEFAAAGIKAPPTTMEQFAVDIAKLTKVDKNGNITQLGLGNPDTGTTITTLGYAFGGTWDGPHNNTPSPQNPGAVAGLNFYYDNITKKYGAANVQKFTAGWGQYQSAQDPFFSGKVAMVIDGEWQPPYIKANAPNLKWGVTEVPYPAADPGLKGTTQVTASTLFIPTNAPQKQAAFEFLKFITGEQGDAEFSLGLGVLPARESLITNPRYTATDPQFKVWLQALKSPNLHALGSNPYEAQYQSDYTTAFNAVLDGTMTPAQAIAQLVSQAKQYAASQ